MKNSVVIFYTYSAIKMHDSKIKDTCNEIYLRISQEKDIQIILYASLMIKI